ncbi:phosphodiester glycosidase family protein [Actinocrinis sp.]|uniref:phosphodiester glycosidase family protein n=1 Tax=Actinocrinis sp. TaxID=1920516 RepID=UPI002BB749EC|nr:phosphodiester glycosidase family protein [Actinocrinis sp.]HXR72324.1 phosphodiester glycosidase family protein [Actinocrinis sp.]
MTHGSDGSDYPDYGRPTPPPQRPGQYPEPGRYQGQAPDPYTGGQGESQRAGRSERSEFFDQESYYGGGEAQQRPQQRPQQRANGRPEPYDPFQTRAHDEQAERRRRDGGQATGQGRGRHGGDGRSYGGDAYGRERAGYAANGSGNQGRGRDPYNGANAYGENGYEYGDGRAPQETRAYGTARPRATERLSATTVLDARAFAGSTTAGPRTGQPESRRRRAADPDESGDPNEPGNTSGRRKAKKVVPPHIRRRRKIIRRSILGVFLIFFGYVGVTFYPYLTAPGTDRLNARVAEWGRDHHLGWAVTWLENATYKPPPTGGGLNASQIAQLQGATAAPPAKPNIDLPANITPLASGTVPGEGVWHPVTMDAHGVPIVEKSALRPDAQHTSDLAYAVWMNQKALSFTLHPGYQQPGGTWKTPDTVPADQRANLVATWNGGFKVKPDDALAGFYMDGKSAVPLVNGKAAEVFYTDGSIKIGQWGRDETMGPNIQAVRQNLSLLVDNGQLTVGPGDGSSAQWGYTIKNSYFIARSGVGMTAKGDIVYVSGKFLSVYTLAKLLQAAGAVDAMELDINPDWVSFMSYGGDPANPTITKLWDFTQPKDRYFQPSDRDFVSVGKR